MNQLCMYQVPHVLCKRLGVGRGGQRHRFVDVCHALCAELSVRPGRLANQLSECCRHNGHVHLLPNHFSLDIQ